MNEDRILDKLDGIEQQNREMLVAVTQLQERVRDVTDHETRLRGLETWRWVTSGSLFMGASSLVTALFQMKGGA